MKCYKNCLKKTNQNTFAFLTTTLIQSNHNGLYGRKNCFPKIAIARLAGLSTAEHKVITYD